MKKNNVSLREQRILDYLEQKNTSTYQDLENLLQVSSMTARRDVQRLSKRGLLVKTLGGALRSNAPQFLYETSLLTRSGVQRAEKRAIAREALAFFKANQTLYLDGSSTCIEFSRLIAKSNIAVTVITNSVLIAMELGQAPKVNVICLGGEYDAQSACLGGTLTEEDAQKFYVDSAFISTKAFIPEEGTYESSIGTLRVKQLLASRCTKLVLLVDHSKFGQRALCKVLDIGAIHVVVTDTRAPSEALRSLKKRGCEVVVASMTPQTGD